MPSGGQPSDSNTHNRRGHGRRAAAEYSGAETVFCPVDAHPSGQRCPHCERGRLYPSRPLVRLRFTGQSLALVTRFELEQLRCNTCGALWVASMPPEAPPETYDISLKVNLAVAHYQLGLPFKRIEAFQALLADFPDSPKAPDALLKIGYTHYELEEWDQARAALTQVQEDYPDSTLSRLAENRLRSMRMEGHY